MLRQNTHRFYFTTWFILCALLIPSVCLGQDNQAKQYLSNRIFGEELKEVGVFGSSYFTNQSERVLEMNQNKPVPADYVIGPGDVFLVKIRGVVNEEYRVEINTRGVLSFSTIPSIYVAGLTLKEAREKIKELTKENYKNVDVEIEILDLKNIEVIISGNVRTPGVYTVRGNSTFLDLMYISGGPTRFGSFRNIVLNRTIVKEDGSREVVKKNIDLYDVFIFGNHTPILLQSADRISIPEIAKEATIFGQIKHPAQYEWNDNFTLQDIIQLSGGFTPNAAREYIEISRIQENNGYTFFTVDYTKPESKDIQIHDGDIIKIPTKMEILTRDNVIVDINGRVNYPGRYILPKDSTLDDLIKASGGLKKDAFLPGTQITRSSLRNDQQKVQQAVIKDIESQIMRIQAEMAENAVLDDDQKLLMKAQSLRQNILESQGNILFNGRLIFNPSKEDPILHNNDNVTIPTEPNAVSIIGAVYNSGSFTYHENWSLNEYLELVGGTTPYADKQGIYVIKSYGHIVKPNKQESNLQIEKGDIIVIPMDYQLMMPTKWEAAN